MEDVQTLIVRQSSLKAAVDFAKDKTFGKDDIINIAEYFEDWVFRTEEKELLTDDL